jgi:DNA repair exonuclease SbcCD ATPase subunit
MILRSLEVEGFRCFDRMVAIRDFALGLNVLAGPNGAGKSTLLRALRHVLLDAYGLSGAVVKQSMQPWGRALSPRIRVELENAGTVWRLEKRFLTGAYARLEREELGGFRPIAEGREAEAAVRKILLAEAAPKGMAREEHMGLLQVLWTPQGAPLLPDWSAGVRTTLQSAFGAALGSQAADQLVALADKRASEYFAPAGGAKKASPVSVLQQETAQLREQLEGLRSQWQAASRNREALTAIRVRVAAEAARLAELEPERERAAAYQGELATLTAAELQARQAFASLEARAAQWRTDIAARAGVEQERAEAELRQSSLQAQLEEAQAMEPRIREMEAAMEELQAQGGDAKLWPDLLRWRRLTGERAAVRAQLESLAAPPRAVIEEMRRLLRQLEINQAGLAAASLRVKVEAEARLELNLDGERRTLGAGEEVELVRPQSISLLLPGVARITAGSANTQAAELEQAAATLQARIGEIVGGDTAEELEARYLQAEAIRQQLDAIEVELRPLDGRRAEWESIAGRRPEWEVQAPEVEAIRTDWKRRKELLDAARGQFQLTRITGEEAAARTLLGERRRQAAELAERLAQHAASGTLEELEQRRGEAELRFAAARGELMRRQAAAPGDLAGLEQQIGSLRAALRKGREEAARMEGELSVQASQNLYGLLAETEERLAERSAQLQRHSRRASAIQLLQTTLKEAQASLTAALPEQIAEQATMNWRQIAGAAAPAIRIDSAWRPDGLAVADANPALEELSGGEWEQVAFATRLALATQLARDGRQLAVFDDAFLATDPERAGRILELLAAAAERLQILILTCHPDRYDRLSGVRHFDLEKLKQ